MKEDYSIKNPLYSFKCDGCGKLFWFPCYTQYKTHKSHKKTRGSKSFCCSECRKKYYGTKILKCSFCGKEIRKIKSAIKENNFCSKECYYRFIRLKRKNYNKLKNGKKCLNCNSLFYSKNKNALFCCKKCESLFKLRKSEIKILQGGNIGERTLKTYLLRVFGNKCMSKDCCWDWDKNNMVKLELHHIDGNHKNNTLQNCLLLCPNCHSLTENYKYKGKHKSTRVYRKKYYKDGSGDRT